MSIYESTSKKTEYLESHILKNTLKKNCCGYNSIHCIHEAIEKQVKETPNNIAVKLGNDTLTYNELNNKANQLAHYLISEGIKPDTLVGLFVERSLEMVVGILGILKAGGAYLPLDPSYPQERLQYMIKDSHVNLILSCSYLSNKIDTKKINVINIDINENELLDSLSKENISVSDINLFPNNLAYVIYTSGSTGKPKGVMVEHTNVTRLFSSSNSHFNFDNLDVWTLFHSYSFDFSVWEIFGALLYGGKLIIVPYVTTRSPTDLCKLLKDEEVTILNQTPSAFYQLAAALVEYPTSHKLRCIIFGGEALDYNQLSPWYSSVNNKNTRLINMYGITETTVHVTFYEITKENINESFGIIGRPLNDLSTYVLDSEKKIQPVNEPGELYVGGPGLARGYLNRSDLTADRFIKYPFDDNKYPHLYKTGDLVKQLPSGDLQYVGRIDHQVKIRGFRIELGEIESTLTNHNGVQDAAVIADKNQNGVDRLVAYLVKKPGKINQQERYLLITDLKFYLNESLPNFMIPSIFIFLDEMPLTQNGKLDRKSLPVATKSDLYLQDYVAPRTPVEEELCSIWEDILKLEKIGINDNFFELGGDSLLATKLISSMSSSFDLKVSFSTIFDELTISKLVNKLDIKYLKKLSSPVIPMKHNELSPLSYAQRRMWFVNHVEINSINYKIQKSFSVSGLLNVAFFKKAVNEIILRHEALRTIYLEVSGEVFQKVNPILIDPVYETDLSQLSDIDQTNNVEKFIQHQSLEPFDLANDLMIRVNILKLSNIEHMIIFEIHHIAFDGWSMGVLFEELDNIYHSLTKNTPRQLNKLPLQYRDYSLWQREKVMNDHEKVSIHYWKEKLKNIPEVHSIPLDNIRPDELSFNGGSHSIKIEPELYNKIIKLCHENNLTQFIFFETVLAILISRYSNQDDVIIGFPIAGREHKDFEGLIGFFVNTLILRHKLNKKSTFIETLNNNKSNIIEAYDHQDVPFEILVDELKPTRSLSYNPLCQIIIEFRNKSQERLKLDNLDINIYPEKSLSTRFDIELHIETGDYEATLEWVYNLDLFNEKTISEFANAFITLLTGYIDDPEIGINALPLTNESEDVLFYPQKTMKFDSTSSKCIHELIEYQAMRSPNDIAVKFEQNTLTYKELNEKANRIAHFLIDEGVKPDMLVGLYIDRSLDMIIGILAILKSGGAYLPLDPSYPEERIQYMLEDSGVKLLLINSACSGNFLSDTIKIINISECEEDKYLFDYYSNMNIPVSDLNLKSSNLAYVIYTSGSTGRPKGVMIEHNNVIRLFSSSQVYFSFDNTDTWTLFHSFAFDFSVWEIFGALIYGGKLVVVSYNTSRSPNDFCKLLEDEEISILNQTPSAFYQLTAALTDNSTSTKLRCIIFGGEALDYNQLTSWYALKNSSNVRLINMYGITETTVHVTFYEISESNRKNSIGLIGRPLNDLSALILNSEMKLQPANVIGELYIGGPGLARGYLNRPELNSEMFVNNPFDNNNTSRLYKTGDLVKKLPNGNMEYVGRIDHQVKIRGFRIELGEIEIALTQDGSVREAAVLVRKNENDTDHLVAYIILKSIALVEEDHHALITNLKLSLSKTLPTFMIPSFFVLIDEMPLTSNGKLDRKSLPKPTKDDIYQKEYAAPLTFVEIELCNIWEKVLKLDRVGINDNFFELGGDSIISIQLVSQSKNKGINLNVRDLFKYQTISKLSAQIDHTINEINNQYVNKAYSLLLLNEHERIDDLFEDIYPMTELQLGMVFHSEKDKFNGLYHDIFSYSVNEIYDSKIFKVALDTILHEEPVLRTIFKLDGERPLQFVLSNVKSPLRHECITHLSASEQDAHILNWAHKARYVPFNWSKGPLFSIVIHERSSSSFQISIDTHHAILDGWSTAVLNTRLFDYYTSLLQNKKIPKVNSNWSMKKVCHLELTSLQQVSSKAFWTDKLKDVPQGQLDSYKNDEYSEDVKSLSATFELNDLSSKIIKLAKKLKIPVHHLLITAHLKVISVLTGNRNVLSSIVNNVRPEDIEGYDALGIFLNSQPLNLEIPDCSWKELVFLVNDNATELLEHKNYPLSAIQKNTGLSLSEILFSYTHFHVYEDSDILRKTKIKDAIELTNQNFNFGVNFSRGYKDNIISLTIEYQSSMFSKERIFAVGGYYSKALELMISNIDAQHLDTSLLSHSEEVLLLNEWNDSSTEFPSLTCIHELFEEHEKLTPNKIALICQDQQLTFQELNELSNRLAYALKLEGVVPETLVGLCADRSIEMIVGILGILKAGGAYVPIDPSYPTERIEFMLEDSNVSIVLLQPGLNNISYNNKFKVLDLVISNFTNLSGFPCENLSSLKSGLTTNNLAYVIYTSGTTGKPKGVMIEHKSLVNSTCARLNYFKDDFDVFLLIASISFDSSVAGIFCSLCAGKTLLIPTLSDILTPWILKELIKSKNVTHSCFTPSLYEKLLDSLEENETLESLSEIIVAGEECSIELVRKHVSLLPNVYLQNEYGPTEGTVWCSVANLSTWDKKIINSAVPIGRPIDNMKLYVFSEDLQLTPIGGTGELYIGGVGVARGYLNRPEMTSNRFIPNPLETKYNKIYRTGDLVRYSTNGDLEFVGRVDEQVKIRGYRIELGEIEATLTNLSYIQEALVTSQNINKVKQLVAYIILEKNMYVEALDNKEVKYNNIKYLRNNLRKKLPSHMVPSFFVFIDSLPLTLNGKLDRRALPPVKDDDIQYSEYTAPRNEEERQLCFIWQDALGIKRVGIHDNFFELGGDSILSTQIVSHARNKGILLTVRDLFEKQTIIDIFAAKNLAAVASEFDIHDDSIIRLNDSLSNRLVFAIHPAIGLSTCYRELAVSLTEFATFYGIQSPDIFSNNTTESIDDLVSNYLKIIKKYQPVGPYYIMGWSLGGTIGYEIALRLTLQGEKIAYLCLFDSAPYFGSISDSVFRHVKIHYNKIETFDWDLLTGMNNEDSLNFLENKLLKEESYNLPVPKYLIRSHIEWLFKLDVICSDFCPSRSSLDFDLYLAENGLEHNNRDYGWNEFTSGQITLHKAKGNHYEMFDFCNIKSIIDTVQLRLKNTLSNPY